MAIRFACKCGKHLRAGDTMAGRHTLCPACGALVAIPTAEAAASGSPVVRPQPSATSSPEIPAENDDGEEIGPILIRVRRRNDKDPNKFRKSIWMPLDPDRGPPPEKLPRPARTTRRRYNWQLEAHWYQSLAYPFRAWRLLAALGCAQAGLLVWAAVLMPRLMAGLEPTPVLEPIVFGLATLLLAVYTVGLFDCVLSSGDAGEFRIFRIPGWDVGIVGAASWFVCFLAGPVLPASVGIWYWNRCGDPDPLDRIILAEVAGLTFGYWLLELLSARESGNWLASPAEVVKIFNRLGPRSMLAATAMPAFAYCYVQMTISGLVSWHLNGLMGVPSLAIAGLSGIYGTIFLLRLLGVWSFRSRPSQPEKLTTDGTELAPEQKEDP